jgi:hypothetical protein
VFWRALEIRREDEALAHSLKLTNTLGQLVYEMRPNGPLPSDGVIK